MKDDETRAASGRFLCPQCGHEMNFHAEKIVFGLETAAPRDGALEGVLAEFHACPNPACRYVLERVGG